MIRPKPTKFLVHLPNTETQHKKVATRELQFPRMLFNDFSFSKYEQSATINQVERAMDSNKHTSMLKYRHVQRRYDEDGGEDGGAARR